MKSLSRSIIGLLASPIGIVVLAALDSTIFFSLPGGIDAAVILLAMRRPAIWWLVALMATAGSIAGAALSFWMGIKIGDQGLDRYISPKRLDKIRQKVGTAGALKLAALDFIPPPFPFTPFILGAGALGADATRFLTTLAACRVIRFGVEAALAVTYGRRLLMWLDSTAFQTMVIAALLLGVALTALSIVKFVKSSRPVRAPSRHGGPGDIEVARPFEGGAR